MSEGSLTGARPVEYEPADLNEAKRWIEQLRNTYHREHAYVQRLEAELHRTREVVDIATWWNEARGIHRTRWMERLKTAIKVMVQTPRVL